MSFKFSSLIQDQVSHNTYKIKILPLGFNRLSIISLIKELLVLHKENLIEALLKSNLLFVILVNSSNFKLKIKNKFRPIFYLTINGIIFFIV